MTRSTPFTEPALYDDLGPGSMRSAEVVVPMVMELLAPTSVLDFGSGTGAWLAAFARAGVADIQGLEGGSPDPAQLRVPADKVLTVNLEERVSLGRSFDLAMSLEVAEHLPAGAADQFVESVASHSDCVLFSAAVPGQGGTHHINEQWPAYWADKFAQHGFKCFDVLRELIWDDATVEWWYQQNLFIFARANSEARLTARGLQSSSPRRLIHPDLFMQRTGDGIGIREHLHGLVRRSAGRIKDEYESRRRGR